jgi:parallel beta-helix repeat protein
MIVQKSNIVIDGASHTLQGTGIENGIELSSLTNVTLENMIITAFDYGIYIAYSSQITVIGNSLLENSGGIWLKEATDNIVRKNLIKLNSFDGIYLWSSLNNTLYENNVESNTYGISPYLGSDNKIYHNNFVNNEYSVNPDDPTDLWDDGYPSGGNYWSDYNGSDLYLGELQTEPGSDGIGDTSYVIDGSNTDHYPLMSPWTPPDVAVLNVTSAKRIIGEGYPAYLTAVVENQGGKVENLDTTVYVGQVNVTFQTFLLMGHNSLVHTFSWDSTGFSKGNYTLSTCVEPIEGEEDLADNTMYNDWVFITIPGDVNGDRRVNVLDAILIANSFNSKPGDANWNPNADINCDDRVNILDCIVLAGHFNQSWP